MAHSHADAFITPHARSPEGDADASERLMHYHRCAHIQRADTTQVKRAIEHLQADLAALPPAIPIEDVIKIGRGEMAAPQHVLDGVLCIHNPVEIENRIAYLTNLLALAEAHNAALAWGQSDLRSQPQGEPPCPTPTKST